MNLYHGISDFEHEETLVYSIFRFIKKKMLIYFERTVSPLSRRNDLRETVAET